MENDIYTTMRKKAETHPILRHYTTKSALENMLKTDTFRLSRLDKVNDPCENRRIGMIWVSRIYIGCFTYGEGESDMFWKSYAKKEQGIMIEFDAVKLRSGVGTFYMDEECKKAFENYNHIKRMPVSPEQWKNPSFWAIQNPDFIDIYYTEHMGEYNTRTNNLFCKTGNGCYIERSIEEGICPGLIKGIEWGNEKESRIRVAIQPKDGAIKASKDSEGTITPPVEYIYMKLPKNAIKAIVINPWMSRDENEKRELRKLLDDTGLGHVELRESSMKDQISLI